MTLSAHLRGDQRVQLLRQLRGFRGLRAGNSSISGLVIILYSSSAPSPPVLTSSTREQELPSMFYTCTHPCVHVLHVYIVLLLHFTFHCRAQTYKTKIIKHFVYIIFSTTSKFNFYTTHQVFESKDQMTDIDGIKQ